MGEMRGGALGRWVALFTVVVGSACSTRATSTHTTETHATIAVAEAIAASDPLVAARIATSTLESDGDGATSRAWRSTAPNAHRLGVHLPRDAGGDIAIGLRPDHERTSATPPAYALRLRVRDAAAAPLTLDHGRAVYASIARDADLVFTAADDRVEWFYTLKSAAAPHEFVLDVALPSGLPRVAAESNGALSFADATGKPRLRIATPFAVDARGTKRDAALTWDGARLHLAIDTTDLAYPILLDPAVEHADWEQVGSPTPAARYGAMGAYDSARGKTVLFGGAGGAILNDTWEWDGTSWTLRTPTTSPGVRWYGMMAYDSARGKTVLFGGANFGGQATNDTWEWDGTNWTQRTPATTPPVRNNATMAFDSGRGKTVLFGGYGDGVQLTDTWEWDGTNWTERTPTNAPANGSNFEMTYDSARGKIVMFGGYNPAASTGLAQTWEWDGTNWTLDAPATSPPVHYYATFAFDSVHAKAVLFGGVTSAAFPNNYSSDTWEWDGTTWAQRTLTTVPPPREYAVMAYDSARAKMVLFSGENYPTGVLNDTWEFDDTMWSARTGATSPSATFGQQLAYDSAHGKALLFGGLNSGTWNWDGATWTLLTPTVSPPQVRGNAMMAYDSARGRVVLFAGEYTNSSGRTMVLNDTWEWDGTNWSQRSPSTSPTARCGGAMAYDSARRVSVLYGGGTVGGGGYNACNSAPVGDTWEWDGTNWTLRTFATSPGVRHGAAMAFDSHRAKSVFFGGTDASYNVQADTWEYDGTAWTLATPSSAPPPRSLAGASYDSARGETVLFGGVSANSEVMLSDTWEWDGTNWTQRSANASPPARSQLGMAYDSGRARTVIVGGLATVGYGQYGDTWEYRTYGGACSSALSCDTGYCVDGVCCQSFQCGTCQSCASSGNEGTCSNVAAGAQDPDTCTTPDTCSASGVCGVAQGATCAKNGDCQSGFCADGVCCDTACSGDCQACAQSRGAAVDGFCAIAPAGTPPRTTACGVYACSGTSPTCTSECTDDKGCGAGYFCAVGGICTAQKTQGSACSTVAGQDCLATGCNECAPIGDAASGQCVDGFCCDTACDGACDVCSAAGSQGTCVNAAAGSAGAPSCAPYLCGGSSAACATTCSTNADCADQSYCDATGHCVGTAAPGDACTNDAACASHFCVDGVCCLTACTDQCAACDVPGLQGTCSPITGAPRGSRPACAIASDAGTSDAGASAAICSAGTCDGTNVKSCALPQSSTVCRSDSCVDGTQTFVATCDGQGNCGAVETKTCSPYACGKSACLATCATDTDCDKNSTCNVGTNTCVTAAVCSSSTVQKTPDGMTHDCSPYVCAGGACKTTCNSVADCVAGDVCNSTNQCSSAPTTSPTPNSTGCSCRLGPSDRGARASVTLSLLTLLLAGRRRRLRSSRSRAENPPPRTS